MYGPNQVRLPTFWKISLGQWFTPLWAHPSQTMISIWLKVLRINCAKKKKIHVWLWFIYCTIIIIIIIIWIYLDNSKWLQVFFYQLGPLPPQFPLEWPLEFITTTPTTRLIYLFLKSLKFQDHVFYLKCSCP